MESEINQLIESSTHFLQNMLLDNGKYIYGYFPHFDNEIGFYNILRHSSSTYALIEGLAYLGESLQPVEKQLIMLFQINYLKLKIKRMSMMIRKTLMKLNWDKMLHLYSLYVNI